ncbi:MAG: hypothetical protein CVT64_08915 [Actinobacteria bacterium HGW-Actinobacteria-4]|nr:MAG: hypothetical protein CVT64_08915 [Actinobacteria bacterium HGW-Actinobacteria-4]
MSAPAGAVSRVGAEHVTRARAPRATARAVGLLFLISYATFMVGTSMLEPVFTANSELADFAPLKAQLVWGSLIESVNVFAILGIAVLLYPSLSRAGKGLALGYVAVRVLEGAMYFHAKVSVFSLVALSEDYLDVGAPTGTSHLLMEQIIRADIAGANAMAAVGFIVGAPVLYALLYRSRLVPRFIAVWGLVAVAMLAAGNIAQVNVLDGFSPLMLLFVPIVLNEVFLAVWLLAKGFSAGP